MFANFFSVEKHGRRGGGGKAFCTVWTNSWPCFSTWPIRISGNIFEKGHPRNNPMKLFIVGPKVSEEKIFNEFLEKFHLVAMATRAFDGIKFCEQLLKRTTQGTFLPSLVQIYPVVQEKMLKDC